MSQSKRKKAIGKFFAFGAVPLSIFIGVLVYPFMQGFYLTFTDWNGFDYTKISGFNNYRESLTDSAFWTTLSVEEVKGKVKFMNILEVRSHCGVGMY